MVFPGRIEEVSERFDVAVARAFASAAVDLGGR